MGAKYISAVNGLEAWNKVLEITEYAESEGRAVTDKIQFILTDIEMPEMDGYILTRKIKEDKRFEGIPVVMHSSLSADANQTLGQSVRADAYEPKFKPRELASKFLKMQFRSDHQVIQYSLDLRQSKIRNASYSEYK
jgi:two-component system chemotaxis response regulator CheV